VYRDMRLLLMLVCAGDTARAEPVWLTILRVDAPTARMPLQAESGIVDR
jgi:hypothetical protein